MQIFPNGGALDLAEILVSHFQTTFSIFLSGALPQRKQVNVILGDRDFTSSHHVRKYNIQCVPLLYDYRDLVMYLVSLVCCRLQ